MAKGETYEQFVAKFKTIKTTDDCYTPPDVYKVVADYVEQRYGLDKSNFIRPFFPGGDYENYNYFEQDIVVDNPPFSIFTKIIDFYLEKNIKFFLFAPHLTIFSGKRRRKFTAVITGIGLTYENGAKISTNFATNLENISFRSAPTLYKKLKEVSSKKTTKDKSTFPKYSYTKALMRSCDLKKLSQYGIDFTVDYKESIFVEELDQQKEYKKSIYGGGFLISEEKQKEYYVASNVLSKNEEKYVYNLSKREQKLIDNLG
ncbi:MAG: hypothetical protein IIW54_06680 [Lachnospiraceae bacterium]|nr:hypothetical protein [Lachnospiraceae bacterium]